MPRPLALAALAALVALAVPSSAPAAPGKGADCTRARAFTVVVDRSARRGDTRQIAATWGRARRGRVTVAWRARGAQVAMCRVEVHAGPRRSTLRTGERSGRATVRVPRGRRTRVVLRARRVAAPARPPVTVVQPPPSDPPPPRPPVVTPPEPPAPVVQPPAPPPPAPDVADAFAGAALDPRWAGPMVAGASVPTVADGLARGERAGGNHQAVWAPGGAVRTWADVDVSVTVAGVDVQRLYGRVQPGTVGGFGHCYELEVENGMFWLSLRSVPGYAELTPHVAPAVPLRAGDRIALRIVGTQLEGWHRPAGGAWQRVVGATDATWSSGGVGISLGGTATRLDDFTAGPPRGTQPG